MSNQKKLINLEGLLLYSYRTLKNQLYDMYKMTCNSDPLDESYINDIEKEIKFLMHTISTYAYYRDLNSKGANEDGN